MTNIKNPMKTMLAMVLLLITFSVRAQQVAKHLTASNGRLIGFLEYKPEDYDQGDNTKKYPLIIFLHGKGNKGNGTTELSRVTANGIPKYIEEGNKMTFTWNGKSETFLVLTPQLSPDFNAWPTFYAEEMIQYAKANLNIDTNRIILTGLSLGGGGVWNYSGSDAKNTSQLAAIGVSCGTKPLSSYKNIADQHLPTWAFHASDDEMVSVKNTLAIIRNIKSYQPATKPYQTIWPTGGHAIWDKVFDTTHNYQNPNIYEWFLAQNKSYEVNRRPIANAGKDITVSRGRSKIVLNASGSSDPDGKLERFLWRQISGPVQTEISAPESKNGKCQVSGATAPGVYSYELKAIDNRADYSLDTVSLTVINNLPPVSVAGSAQEITDDITAIELDGTSSSDSDGVVKKYSWSMTEGPSAAVILNPDSARTTVSGMVPGFYTFRLTVTDDNEMTAISYTTVTVTKHINLRPRARAGKDTILTAPQSSYTADGSNSYDRDGQIIRYKWIKLLGPSQFKIETPDSAMTTFSDLLEGRYKFRLIVFDDRGDSAMDNLYIEVKQLTAIGATYKKGFNIEEAPSEKRVRLYPNPASVNTTLEFYSTRESKGSITMLNAGGQQVKLVQVAVAPGINRILLHIQGCKAGTYYVRVVTVEGTSCIQQLVVN
ncbi:MAG TPA: PKD domain-containing protein [Flavitalea sp.]|nr:PKD domain-containing protein [Flavitalea sp.]